MKRNTVWAIAITLAAAGFAGACGSTIDDTSGSGGAGSGGKAGTGGSSATAPPGTGGAAPNGGAGPGSGGSIGTGGTAGTGGGDECTKACDHAAACGEDICSQIPNFSCDNPQYKCVAGCVDGAKCSDIEQAVNFVLTMMGDPGPVGECILGTCMNAGTGGSSPGTGGGAPNGCQMCAGNSCGTQVGACFRDQDCQAWLGCANNCNFVKACTDGCDAAHPGSAALYDPIYACACSSCSSECAAADPCHH